MAAARQPQQSKTVPMDTLQNAFNEVVVQTGKVFKSAGKDGKANVALANMVVNSRIPASIESFNFALDDLEGEILKAKTVIQRDLNLLKANRRPPQPEQRAGPPAPPAPMSIDLGSPSMGRVVTPVPIPIPGQTSSPVVSFQPFQGPNPNSGRPVKQDHKPVAPFPNMGGFDLTVSPEVKAVPVPSPKPAHKVKEPKNSPRPSMAAKPASVPPRKETKILPPQPPRPASATPQTSPTMVKKAAAAQSSAIAQSNHAPRPPLKQTPVPVPVIPPHPASVSAPAPAPPPPAPMPPTTGAENIFTDMAFSLAPPETPGGTNNQTQPQEIDLVALGAGSTDLSNFTIDSSFGTGPDAMANLGYRAPQHGGGNDANNVSGVDEKIDNLFDLGSAGIDNIEMNYDLGDNGGDNSSFNDMFFNMNDDNMATDEFEQDHAYFGK
ncbi:hypothetical protein B0H66DRAFT_361194 [Apodospora peruviana]|uniref:Uncharacterized protein n=1 Tax=Apodospora peruviana TaxID=516989 RepID=A0AAE0HVP9_9PEZI|nr:hypothetical protein B0H66DRAFT_361194 [Apodospora peruviana]